MKIWALNVVLYLALGGWMVCTYFCTVDGYDHIPEVRDSYCRPHDGIPRVAQTADLTTAKLGETQESTKR